LVDQLRDRFGEGVVVPGRLLKRDDLAPERVAFGKPPAVEKKRSGPGSARVIPGRLLPFEDPVASGRRPG
jgi:hypothetical protein